MDINFTGPCNMTGYGLVGGNLVWNLIESGHNVAFWPLPSLQYIEAHPSKHNLIKTGVDNQARYNPKAPSFRHFHQFDLAQHVGKGPHIGSTVFELNRFSDREIQHLKNQDALAVPTAWAKDILEMSGINLPTLILPHGVDRAIFNENIEPVPDYFEPNSTTFINIGKWEIRKGHDVLVEAFNRAFEPSDNVRLILACYNPFYDEKENKDWESLYKESRLGDKIDVIPGRLAIQQDIAGLMACADCGVFPSKAEGWGLESLEMMSMGKQVIITNYAGHTEYAHADNSLLIDPDGLEDAFDGKWFHGQGQWMSFGEPQMEQLIMHLRDVHAKKQGGVLGINVGGIETANHFSWNQATEKLVKFLGEL